MAELADAQWAQWALSDPSGSGLERRGGFAAEVWAAADGVWPVPALATRRGLEAILADLQAGADAAGLITGM